MIHIILKLFYFILFIFSLLLSSLQENSRLVIGCITETGENGINVCDFNTVDGTLKIVSGFNAGPNPSYFCISEKRKMIYTINEVSKFKGTPGGGLTTLKYDGNFENIKKVKEITVPNGGPCFISISADNDFLFIANYGGGSVAVVKLDKNGIPETVCDTIIYNGMGKKVSHAHMISPDQAGKHIYVTDLGLDRIMIYTLDNVAGKLIPLNEEGISLPPGTGPRHFVFNESGSILYVIGELGSTVSVFKVAEEKSLILIQTISTRNIKYSGTNYCADIHIGKSGSFLYGSNRGENSIVTFKIEKDGYLSLAGHSDCGGNWPRNFVMDPSGNYILVGNQKSGNITTMKIDQKSGIPAMVTQNLNLNAPVCLKF
jgi:6-phosphogluconolactonase